MRPRQPVSRYVRADHTVWSLACNAALSVAGYSSPVSSLLQLPLFLHLALELALLLQCELDLFGLAMHEETIILNRWCKQEGCPGRPGSWQIATKKRRKKKRRKKKEENASSLSLPRIHLRLEVDTSACQWHPRKREKYSKIVNDIHMRFFLSWKTKLLTFLLVQWHPRERESFVFWKSKMLTFSDGRWHPRQKNLNF